MPLMTEQRELDLPGLDAARPGLPEMDARHARAWLRREMTKR
jgi:hypothetical protein